MLSWSQLYRDYCICVQWLRHFGAVCGSSEQPVLPVLSSVFSELI